MLSSKNRINKKLFDEVFKKGKVFNSKFFVLKHLLVKKGKRFAFVVSSSVSGSAVKRNLLKRRGKYILDLNKDKIKEGTALIFLFKKESLNAEFKEIKKDILFLLDKL
ncbi:MAG: ribonuclease P protein component [Candidatus Paceibacterota bacterium]